MRKIVDYDICSSCRSAADLRLKVKELIRLGYEPIGGVSNCEFVNNEMYPSSTTYISQAMVKYQEETK